MRLGYDHEADAVYVYLRDVPVSFTESLDHRRGIDDGADEKLIGVELLSVSKGIDVSSLPEQGAIVQLLEGQGLIVGRATSAS